MGVASHPEYDYGLDEGSVGRSLEVIQDFPVKRTFIDFEARSLAARDLKCGLSDPTEDASFRRWAGSAVAALVMEQRSEGGAAVVCGSEVSEPTAWEPPSGHLCSTPEQSPRLSRSVVPQETALSDQPPPTTPKAKPEVESPERVTAGAAMNWSPSVLVGPAKKAARTPRMRPAATPILATPMKDRSATTPALATPMKVTPAAMPSAARELSKCKSDPTGGAVATETGLVARQSPKNEPDAHLPRSKTREKTRLVLSEQLLLDSPQKKHPFQDPWAEHLGLGFAVPGNMTPTRTSQTAPEWTPEQPTAPPPRFPTSAAGRCEASLLTPSVPALSCVGAGIFFSFTIRRADDQSLGLKVERSADARGLVVREICKNGGAIEAWNMQCVGPAAAKAVQAGDKIVCVNGVSCCDGMLGEIQAKYLLKLLVVRGASDYAPGVEVATDGEYVTEGVSERRCTANPETVVTAVSGPCMTDASQGWWTLPGEYY